MKGLKFTQIAIIIFAVLVKNLIFQYYGWEYDVFSDGFDLVKIIAHIGAVIAIIFGVSFIVSKLSK
jgi:prepilin signal peptidase PulO-like enzyme (type II secretory pathway)